METEEWRDVPGYEERYQVSNLGRIKSLARKRSDGRVLKKRIRKLWHDSRGYLQVSLHKNSTRKKFKIHKLVAVAFLGHIPSGHNTVVDHINGNKLDNCVSNLQLITQRENVTRGKSCKGGTSQYVGVYWGRNKWVARIWIDGKYKHLGRFTLEIEASNVYQQKLQNL